MLQANQLALRRNRGGHHSLRFLQWFTKALESTRNSRKWEFREENSPAHCPPAGPGSCCPSSVHLLWDSLDDLSGRNGISKHEDELLEVLVYKECQLDSCPSSSCLQRCPTKRTLGPHGGPSRAALINSHVPENGRNNLLPENTQRVP